ncbi:putative dehydrogenase [Bradyrhizobium japonicum]
MPPTHGHVDGEFRSIGVADMAAAILNNRPHRASGALAFHVLEVMEAFQTSADDGRRVMIESRVERPAMLPAGRETGQID